MEDLILPYWYIRKLELQEVVGSWGDEGKTTEVMRVQATGWEQVKIENGNLVCTKNSTKARNPIIKPSNASVSHGGRQNNNGN